MAHVTLKQGGTRIAKQTEEKRKKNPVDNVAFYSEIKDYLQLRKAAVDAGKDIPQIPDCIGSKIYMIADILSKKFYFIGYSYIDEMKMDAVLNCIQYIDKFDPERTNNPFSYFTQVCFYAFIRRVQTEKKQTYTKGQIVKHLGTFFEELTLHEGDLDADYHTTMGEILASQGDDNLEKLFGKKAKVPKVKKETHADYFEDIEVDDDIDIDATIALHNVVEGLTSE
jgi:hypothetical protein